MASLMYDFAKTFKDLTKVQQKHLGLRGLTSALFLNKIKRTNKVNMDNFYVVLVQSTPIKAWRSYKSVITNLLVTRLIVSMR
jgi:hypothetical protein